MFRLTVKTDSGFVVSDTGAAVQRLGIYEDIYEALERDQKKLAERMEALRASGRERTAQYRELFTRKLQNAYALSLFQARGL